jgi:AraC-like DNA-binding protein
MSIRRKCCTNGNDRIKDSNPRNVLSGTAGRARSVDPAVCRDRSYAQGISNAIHLINRDYSKTLVIEELAEKVSMSPTSLHKNFKRVTEMSPLLYQKIISIANCTPIDAHGRLGCCKGKISRRLRKPFPVWMFLPIPPKRWNKEYFSERLGSTPTLL